MRLILALGNSGEKYRDTRHNVGWWLADRLARRWSAPGFQIEGPTAWTRDLERDVELHKPLTFMNRSGEALEAVLETRDVDTTRDLLVLVDDISLPPGRLRLRSKGSAGGHNGLTSLERTLGTDVYPRLRIGVGRPHDSRIDLAAWVLASMPRAEEENVHAALGRATEGIELWLDQGADAAMRRVHT